MAKILDEYYQLYGQQKKKGGRFDMKCPECGSSLFHVERIGDALKIKCYRTEQCGWILEAEVKT
jgi:Zn finger protein HypA/HybF involved in hydrogenase expression